ncbi:MAG TPA: DUF4173 domain-containing protein [Gemmatimonadaceae bacterium]|nr:DUF4173 domain-containing protein [Gemmatimonadaceae bacterium]
MAVGIADADKGDMTGVRTRAARRILIEAGLLGVLADGALRNAPDGLGWTLWVVALALAAVNVARRAGLSVTREQIAWLGAAVACAAAFSWRDAEELRVANVFGTLVALSMFAMSAAGLPAASILVARVRDVVTAGVYTVRDLIAGAPMLMVRDAELHALPAVRRGASWTAVRAVLLTVPLVLVFTVLLSRADPVFASVFRLPELDAELLLSHVLIAGAFAWWSAGWIRGALLGVAQRPALPERLPVRLGLGEVTTSLGAVIALFTIFVALQLRWLFGGAEVVLATTGLTVAEYARRGFFELVAVAALVLPLILVTRSLIEDEKVIRRHRQLSLAMIVLLAPIMASALLRMQLYVGHFGLTTDRLYATALMLWLGLVFVAMARTVLRGWARPFAAMAMLSGFATVFTLNALNPERLVARVNLGRSLGDHGVDYVYLARLSGDAAPAVVTALEAAAPSPIACKAAESLRTRWTRRQDTSWNLGARRGHASVMNNLSDADVQRLCAGAEVGVTSSPVPAP